LSTRASILLWSAGSGVVLGLILDTLLFGAWMVTANFVPALAPRNMPRWALITSVAALGLIPLAAGVLGYLEGRLKLS
jgi:hypothetical protein